MTRSGTRTNNSEVARIVAQHVMTSPVSRVRGVNTSAAHSIRRLVFAIPSLWRIHRHTFTPNFWFRANTGQRFARIFRNAQVVTRHRNGNVTFRIPRGHNFAGTYTWHRNGHLTGNRAQQITGGNRIARPVN